jgi:hypothetical protein
MRATEAPILHRMCASGHGECTELAPRQAATDPQADDSPALFVMARFVLHGGQVGIQLSIAIWIDNEQN